VLAIEHAARMHSEYDAWIAAGLNNADLAAVATYFDCVPGFQNLLQQKQGDLQQFYSAVRALAHDPSARRALCRPATDALDARAALHPRELFGTPVAAGVAQARATAEPAH